MDNRARLSQHNTVRPARLEEHSMFSSGYDRERAERELATMGRPIVRSSSQPNKYAVTFFNHDGQIKHSLITATEFVHRGVSGSELALYLQGLDRRFGSLEELIEFVKNINPTAYSVEIYTGNTEDPQPLEGGIRHRNRRRLSRRRQKISRRRKNTLRKRRNRTA
jgi:hypothetical protein